MRTGTIERAHTNRVCANSARIALEIDDVEMQTLGFDADPGFDFDQTPVYDLTEPEPVSDFDFDQGAGA
ncbi:MAG TPA: hypothetical protein VMN60_12245 [Longimicrobiales bacterium]|nr:hypothetical protein [Longimicrobiales bacterium]